MASHNTKCQDCSETFPSKIALSQHVAYKGHMSDKYCLVCRRPFKRTEDLERHNKDNPIRHTQESPGQDASVPAVIKQSSAFSSAGCHQATETSGAQKPSNMMMMRQKVADAPASTTQISSPNSQNLMGAIKSQQLIHNANVYSVLTKTERRSLAADLLTRCHTKKRLQQQGFFCLTADSAGSSSPASPDSTEFLPLPAASTKHTTRKAIAIDCEMVGVANNRSELALVCAVDCLTGETLINSFVHPGEAVLDWRTSVSGVSPAIMAAAQAEGRALAGWEAARAMLFRHVNADTIVVGHSVNFDLRVLRISHTKIVDSSILTGEAVFGKNKKIRHSWGLKQLCQELLGLTIQHQSGEGHNCLEDTLATRELVLRCLRCPHELEAWAKRAAKQIPARRLNKSRKAARPPRHKWATTEEEEEDDYGDVFYDTEMVRWEDIAEDFGWPHPDTGYDPWSD